MAEVLAVVMEYCRECRDEEPSVLEPAEFILWGKLLPPEALGPKCYIHAARHIGWQGMTQISQYAAFDLRGLYRGNHDPAVHHVPAVRANVLQPE